MIKEEKLCRQNAYSYYWPELNGKCKPGWLLHHKDPSWKIEDPERYHQWNIEDLIPMTFSEHTRWHIENDPEFRKTGEKNPMFGKHHSVKSKKKISEAMSGENHPMFGTHLSAETKKKISESLIGKLAGENSSWFGKYHSAESKKKIGEVNLGTHWYNNGEINVRAKVCPEGFRKGRLI